MAEPAKDFLHMLFTLYKDDMDNIYKLILDTPDQKTIDNALLLFLDVVIDLFSSWGWIEKEKF